LPQFSQEQLARTIVNSNALTAITQNLNREKQLARIPFVLIELRGNNKKIQSLENKEVILFGGAGTGKSVGNLVKIHNLCRTYPNLRVLIVRKTRESLTETGMVTFEKLLPDDCPLTQGLKRNFRQHYKYPNGSIIVLGGLDNPIKIMSGDYDLIFVQEAGETEEADWEMLSTRLRNNSLFYQQIIGDCNPGPPDHWIKKREGRGKLTLLETKHEDNPRFYDLNKQDWTNEGKEYLALLEQLSGERYWQLRHGKWTQAEGLVYEKWRDCPEEADNSNVYDDAYSDYFEGEPVLWGVDDGYSGEFDKDGDFTPDSHPRVILFAQERRNGDLVIFDEIYKIKTLPEDQIKEALENPYAKPDIAIVDRSAATLKGRLYDDNYIMYENSKGTIDEGVKELRSWIAPDQNGHRRLIIHTRCKYLRREMVSYVNGKDGKPLKKKDHGPDVLRYLVMYLANRYN